VGGEREWGKVWSRRRKAFVVSILWSRNGDYKINELGLLTPTSIPSSPQRCNFLFRRASRWHGHRNQLVR
jgi:hypothetical protein